MSRACFFFRFNKQHTMAFHTGSQVCPDLTVFEPLNGDPWYCPYGRDQHGRCHTREGAQRAYVSDCPTMHPRQKAMCHVVGQGMARPQSEMPGRRAEVRGSHRCPCGCGAAEGRCTCPSCPYAVAAEAGKESKKKLGGNTMYWLVGAVVLLLLLALGVYYYRGRLF